MFFYVQLLLLNMILRFIHIVCIRNIFFLFNCPVVFHCMNHHLFIHSHSDKRVGCVQVWTISKSGMVSLELCHKPHPACHPAPLFLSSSACKSGICRQLRACFQELITKTTTKRAENKTKVGPAKSRTDATGV